MSEKEQWQFKIWFAFLFPGADLNLEALITLKILKIQIAANMIQSQIHKYKIKTQWLDKSETSFYINNNWATHHGGELIEMARKYGEAAQESVETAMHKMKEGKLKSGRSGKKVTSRRQAIAIGLSEARKKEAKVPRPPK